MDEKDIEDFIAKFDEEKLKEESIVGLFHFGDNYESHIKANKNGLYFFAIQILKATKEFDLKLEEKKLITLDYNPKPEFHKIGDVIINCIEPITNIENTLIEKFPNSIKDKLLNWFFGGIIIFILLLLLISIFIGLNMIFSWIF